MHCHGYNGLLCGATDHQGYDVYGDILVWQGGQMLWEQLATTGDDIWYHYILSYMPYDECGRVW